MNLHEPILAASYEEMLVRLTVGDSGMWAVRFVSFVRFMSLCLVVDPYRIRYVAKYR